MKNWQLEKGMKAILVYDTPFGRGSHADGLTVIRLNSPTIIVVDNSQNTPHGVLLIFADPQQLPPEPKQRCEALVQAVSRALGKRAQAYTQYFEQEWSAEPFIGGCISLVPPGVLSHSGEPFDLYDKNTGAFDSAHLVSSRSSTEFEDFPMPSDYPEFPGKQQMQAYLRSFAEAFGISPHVRLGRTIKRVYPAPDAAATGDWLVDIAGETTQRYSTVIIANGHLLGKSKPRDVNYPGSFTGQLLQANQYNNAQPFRGQRVLVVGAGNTGCDIAVDASFVAAKVHISLREGKYFLPKTFMGKPISDLVNPKATGSRYERWMERLSAMVLYRLTIGKASLYGLPEPQHRIFDKHPTINSQLPYQIKQGAIQAFPEIKAFHGDAVEFVDGRREAYDVIVLALGYHVTFPMLHDEDKLLEWDGAI